MRGYRENTLVRDNGLSLSVEGRIPLTRLALPFTGDERREGVTAFLEKRTPSFAPLAALAHDSSAEGP